MALADRWIVARCDAAVREATAHYEALRLNEAAFTVYHFLWTDLADWYLEQVKPRLYGDTPGGDVARAVLCQTFDAALRLLHPVMPFITEALWQRLPGRPAGLSLSRAPWPRPDARAHDDGAVADFALVQELVAAIRGIRAEYAVAPGQAIRARVARRHRAFDAERGTVLRLAKLADLEFGPAPEAPGAHAVLADGTGVFVPLGDLVDLDRERQRLDAERARLAGLITGQERKLANAQFVTRAPADVVGREREKLASWRTQCDEIDAKLARLGA
jgi:valyl-tRNA synthetase